MERVSTRGRLTVAPKKVLIIDDELILAENLKAYLETKDCDAWIAHNGAEAIRQAVAFGPEMLVLDYRLQDMNGLLVLEVLRGWLDSECVLITAHPTEEVCEGAARLGITHILLKPFPLAELGRVVCKP